MINPLNARDPDWAEPELPPPRTISWNEWIGTLAPTIAPHPDWTVTVHDLRIT